MGDERGAGGGMHTEWKNPGLTLGLVYKPVVCEEGKDRQNSVCGGKRLTYKEEHRGEGRCAEKKRPRGRKSGGRKQF